MSDFSEFFKDGNWVSTAAQVVPAIISIGQANAAKNDVQDLQNKIDNFQRQELINPYANMSNPYQNLSVATKAAEMKAEQSDIALANTLDNLRQTGAGGATALAQAALRSKKDIASDIERQEAQNQRLIAQGQLNVDRLKARGAERVMQFQEARDLQELNRLQGQLEGARLQQLESRQAGLKALGSGLKTFASNFGSLAPGEAPLGTTIGIDPETGMEMSFAPGFKPGE